MKIFTIADKKEEKFLRIKTADFNFQELTKKEINELIKKMRETMTRAIGVGLSANQVGLNLKMFIALIPEKSLEQDEKNKIILSPSEKMKFYAIFNPEIIKFSEKKSIMEEGCLSVPGIYGLVKRSEKITLIGQDKNAKKIKIKAFGLLAVVFQHEVDHLNGVLFIDRCKKIYSIEKS
ncbi:MAG: peptide deformylase [Patescibacteria group bacterium]